MSKAVWCDPGEKSCYHHLQVERPSRWRKSRRKMCRRSQAANGSHKPLILHQSLLIWRIKWKGFQEVKVMSAKGLSHLTDSTKASNSMNINIIKVDCLKGTKTTSSAPWEIPTGIFQEYLDLQILYPWLVSICTVTHLSVSSIPSSKWHYQGSNKHRQAKTFKKDAKQSQLVVWLGKECGLKESWGSDREAWRAPFIPKAWGFQ